MTSTETPNTTTPNDLPTGKPRKRGQRGPRKRVLNDAAGDYCVYQIADESMGMPIGSLIPQPNVPKFGSTQAAIRWIRNESGDLLVGKQLMILQAKEILSIEVESKPQVTLKLKPKLSATDPAKDD